MSRMKSKRDRLAVFSAQTPLCTEDQERIAIDLGGIPAHSRVLAQTEEIPRRPIAQHLVRNRQASRRAGRFRLNVKKRGIARAADDRGERGVDGDLSFRHNDLPFLWSAGRSRIESIDRNTSRPPPIKAPREDVKKTDADVPCFNQSRCDNETAKRPSRISLNYIITNRSLSAEGYYFPAAVAVLASSIAFFSAASASTSALSAAARAIAASTAGDFSPKALSA